MTTNKFTLFGSLSERLRHNAPFVSLIATIFLTFFIVFNEGYEGPLIFDSPKIYPLEQEVEKRGIAAMLDPPHFGKREGIIFGRPLSLASFAFNIYLDKEVNTKTIKLTNYIIHAVCALVIFLLTKLILSRTKDARRASWLAFFVAAFWLIAPVNITTAFYAIQRMAQLSALFVLVGLYAYMRLRLTARPAGRALWLVVTIGSLVLAVMSKENGLLLLPLILLVEVYFFSFQNLVLSPRSWAKLTFVGIVLCLITLIMFLPPFLDFSSRPFTMGERLMTQSRVIWFYLKEITLPFQANTGLFNDSYPVSKSLINPWTTLPALLGLIFLVAITIILTRKRKLIGFCLAFYFIANLMESTILPLENVFIHRNYLASVAIFLAAAVVLDYACSSLKNPKWALIFATLYGSYFMTVSHFKAETWASRELIFARGVSAHPHSSRALSGLSQVLTEQRRYNEALQILNASLQKQAGVNRLRVGLQRLHVLCLANRVPNSGDYEVISATKTIGTRIEVGQALNNVIQLYRKGQCAHLDAQRFVSIVDELAQRETELGNDAWLFQFYANELLVYSGKKTAAYTRLEQLFESGEDRAGRFLLDLYREEGLNNRARLLEQKLESRQ